MDRCMMEQQQQHRRQAHIQQRRRGGGSSSCGRRQHTQPSRPRQPAAAAAVLLTMALATVVVLSVAAAAPAAAATAAAPSLADARSRLQERRMLAQGPPPAAAAAAAGDIEALDDEADGGGEEQDGGGGGITAAVGSVAAAAGAAAAAAAAPALPVTAAPLPPPPPSPGGGAPPHQAAVQLPLSAAGEDSLAGAVAAAVGGGRGSGGGGGSAEGAGAAAAGAAAASNASQPWAPRVLDAPVPKFPRLYAAMPLPAPSLSKEARAAAAAALNKTAREAATPQGISAGGIAGIGLEDRLLLARLLGHVVPGAFDEAGRLDAASPAYWAALDQQLERHTVVKHMFESTWYKCGKLNADLLARAHTSAEMEAEALRHILSWLGLQERQLPRPGETASFDDLVALLGAANARARLVTDPVPFLTTTEPPLDRNGVPMLVHVTFRDKGQFARHHLLSLASWARENPDHAILMYDDADLAAYLAAYAEPAVLGLYRGLRTAVERSDLWRYMVMCTHGGVYADADTLCVRPIQEWNSENANDAEVLLGVEDVFRRVDPSERDTGWGVSGGRFGVQFVQWTMAGAPRHPVYCSMPGFISTRVLEEAEEERSGGGGGGNEGHESENWRILHRTGPHVWTDSVLKWMHGQGIGFHEALVPGGRLVANNTRVMPGETFGCAAHFFSPGARLEEVYVMHMFRGGWRKRLDVGGGGSEGALAATIAAPTSDEARANEQASVGPGF